MPRQNELVRVRADDLDPGRRVRLPRRREMVTVIDVSQDEFGTWRISTDDGDVYACDRYTLIDAEDGPSSVRGLA